MPILFDAFGTLFDLQALRQPARELAGEHGDDLYVAFSARLQPWTWLATAAGAYSPLPELARAALESAAAEVGVEPSRVRSLAERLSSLPLFPDASEALDLLTDERLAVLSNGTEDGLAALLEHAGVADRFEHVLAADSVRAYKPSPEVYALAPRAFRLPPAELTLVSSHAWDVAGAKLAGLRGVWVARGRPLAPALGVTPDGVTQELTGLRTFA